jgi:hypothetical protein
MFNTPIAKVNVVQIQSMFGEFPALVEGEDYSFYDNILTVNLPAQYLENATQAPEASAEGGNTTTGAESDDFDSVFGTEGEEVDDGLFTSTASNAGKAARVSAADALNRIKAFDFSL